MTEPGAEAGLRGARVLVVDDDAAVRSALRVNLQKASYEVILATCGEEALDEVRRQEPDLVISDVRMPGVNGEELLIRLRAGWPELPVVLMTGQGSINAAVQAMRVGASDYLIKPVRKDELLIVLERALQHRALRREVAHLRAELHGKASQDDIIGQSAPMQRVFALIRSVAPTDALVLVTGATGTGKELVSKAIHDQSPRAKGPMLAVNCAALPEGLLESELFGHEKGAFTGAVRRHAGKFEQAHHGTLMLDEIGEIPLSTQVRLLRVLQSGELQRVGGQETVRVDVRVIAATNRDLREEVRVGRFREDLFYRLNVFHIEVPALRERPEDIPSLAMHFLRRYATKHRRPATHISPALMLRLQQWRWPGNVRELEHAIERAVLVEPSDELHEVGIPDVLPSVAPSPPGADLAAPATDAGPAAAAPPLANRSGAAAPLDPKPPPSATLPEALDEVERRLILEALEQEGGVQARAAKRLGLSRSNLHYRMQRLGIQRLGVLFG